MDIWTGIVESTQDNSMKFNHTNGLKKIADVKSNGDNLNPRADKMQIE